MRLALDVGAGFIFVVAVGEAAWFALAAIDSIRDQS